VIKFVIKPTDRGWAIYRDDILVSTHPTRRQALKALGVLTQGAGRDSAIDHPVGTGGFQQQAAPVG